MKKLIAVIMSVAMLLALASVCASAAATPEFILTETSDDAAVGDTVDIVLSVKNGKGLACAELHVQFNPYQLAFLGYELSEAANSESGLMIMSADPNESGEMQYAEDGKTPISGIPVYLIHARMFSDNVDNADLCILHFKAIGGGDCRLQFLANDVEMCEGNDEVATIGVAAIAKDISVSIDGDEAPDWDYDVSVPVDVTVPNASSSIDVKKIVIIVLIAILILAAIAALVLAIRQNGVKKDDNGDAPAVKDKGRKPKAEKKPEEEKAVTDEEKTEE